MVMHGLSGPPERCLPISYAVISYALVSPRPDCCAELTSALDRPWPKQLSLAGVSGP